MQALLVNQSPVSSITYSNKMRVIYDGVEQDAELRKYPSGKIYFRTENAHFVPVNEVGVLIPLTQGKNAIVDFEDYEKISQYKWCVSRSYAVSTIEGKTVAMHRFVMGASGRKEYVDHRDGNGCDNRKFNLRLCTPLQSSHNIRKVSRETTSKFKGVRLEKRTNKWAVSIRNNYKRIFLTNIHCENTAAAIYNHLAKEFHGDFANYNVVDQSLVNQSEFEKVLGRLTKISHSQYRGVTKSKNKWIAQIIIDGNRKYIGSFSSEVKAAEAYNNAALTHIGASAKLNEIPNGQ